MAELFLEEGLLTPLDFVSDRLPKAILAVLEKEIASRLEVIDFDYLKQIVASKNSSVQVVEQKNGKKIKEMRVELSITGICFMNGDQTVHLLLYFPLTGEVGKLKPIFDEIRRILHFRGENPKDQMGLATYIPLKEPIGLMNQRQSNNGHVTRQGSLWPGRRFK